jgi:exonuclease SbcC
MLSAERDDLLARQGRLQGDADRRKAFLEGLETLKRSRSASQTEQAIYSDLFAAFGRSGVPAMLIDAAVPRIEAETNLLLGHMTDNRLAVKLETQRVRQAGNVSETLDIFVSDELGFRNYDLFSGGEAFRINLSLRIALSKVLAQRMGLPLPTLFIDEGFGTQDVAGRERIVDAIASIQDEFDKIIVITHLDDLKDLFPVRIEVLKTADGSQFWLS